MTSISQGGLSRRAVVAALPAALAGLPRTAAAQQAAGLTPLQIMAASGVTLSGSYPGHLQGVCGNGRDALYWSMTTTLVKTDASGNVVRQIAVPSHHGAPAFADGKLFVAVNLALFNDAQARADSWIYVYDGEDLSLIERRPVPEVGYGAGGIAFGDGRFIVVGGLPEGPVENPIYEYGRDLKLARKIALKTGPTRKGIQTAAFDGAHWWFGCYGAPEFMEVLIRTDRAFGSIAMFGFDASTGMVPLGGGVMLVARSACGKEACVGSLVPARLNDWIESGRLRALGV